MSLSLVALVAAFLVGGMLSVVVMCILIMGKQEDAHLEGLAARLENNCGFGAFQAGQGDDAVNPLPEEACKNKGMASSC